MSKNVENWVIADAVLPGDEGIYLSEDGWRITGYLESSVLSCLRCLLSKGYLFENLVYKVIAEGGQFQVFDLNTRIWKKEEFPGHKIKQFKQCSQAMELSLTLDKERELDTLNFTGTYSINFYFITLIEGYESFKKAKLGNEWDVRIKQKVIGINLDNAIPKY
ncbi:hypothetical protein L211DRAFT_850676 [Terfezia boudieri ATCC MYA-4762]|uniref:Uncharacterized protein n=1 Tax=Terfezia boudieri ATCC MYA-4762 TaxID=1051890 RepID=A0A3N4LHL7_9PEZI|nr:hypothetical protein L211DRAFT_850676 [Terfezia boudieri ATCC MYA-4762]